MGFWGPIHLFSQARIKFLVPLLDGSFRISLAQPGLPYFCRKTPLPKQECCMTRPVFSHRSPGGQVTAGNECTHLTKESCILFASSSFPLLRAPKVCMSSQKVKFWHSWSPVSPNFSATKFHISLPDILYSFSSLCEVPLEKHVSEYSTVYHTELHLGQ